MKIGSILSKPGQIVEGLLTVATLADARMVEMPLKIAEGLKPGPVVFVSGGMHGNELNGIELAHRFWRSFERDRLVEKLKGTLIFLPILNGSGFAHKSRRVTYDKRDLNRSFGLNKISTSTQIGKTLLEEVVKQCDFGIDLHDSGRTNVLLPHTRVHRQDSAGTQELGSLFGTDIVMVREGASGMLALAAQKAYQVPVVTVEVGGAMVLWDEFLNRGLQGIKNLLIHQGMLSGKIVLPPKQFFLEERQGYDAATGGIARIFWHLGDTVKAGDVLAEIYDPITGKSTPIMSEYCGVVFSRRMQARVEAGDEVLSVMEFESCEHFPKGRQRSVRKSRTFESVQNYETCESLYAEGPCSSTTTTSG